MNPGKKKNLKKKKSPDTFVVGDMGVEHQNTKTQKKHRKI